MRLRACCRGSALVELTLGIALIALTIEGLAKGDRALATIAELTRRRGRELRTLEAGLLWTVGSSVSAARGTTLLGELPTTVSCARGADATDSADAPVPATCSIRVERSSGSDTAIIDGIETTVETLDVVEE